MKVIRTDAQANKMPAVYELAWSCTSRPTRTARGRAAKPDEYKAGGVLKKSVHAVL